MNTEKLTQLQQKEVVEILEHFGLNEKDRRIYLALLSFPESTLTPLGRALRMPVTTIQSALARLHALGIVGVTKRKSRHIYTALDPVVFKRLLEKEIREVTDVIPLLKKLQKENAGETKLRIFYDERMTDIFNEALQCKSKLVYEIVAAKEIQEILGEKFHFTKRRIERNVRLKSLRVESREIKKYSQQTHIRELREAKFLPRELTFRGNIMFWDTTVAFFSTKQEGLAWTVQNPVIYEMIDQLFSLLWSVSRRMETTE